MNTHVTVNTSPRKVGIAPSEVWNNWNNARACEDGRAVIAEINIRCEELTRWKATSAKRRRKIEYDLRPFARIHR